MIAGCDDSHDDDDGGLCRVVVSDTTDPLLACSSAISFSTTSQ